MSHFILDAAVCSDKGRVRQNNEDNFYMNGRWMPMDQMDRGMTASASSRDDAQLFAVCDGMGGESAGEVASSAVVTALHGLRGKHPGGVSPAQLTDALNDISTDIYRQARSEGMRSGSTFVGLLWQHDAMRAANVGDSRAYRLSGGKLKQLSADHSEVQRLVAMGLITPEAARVHPKRNVINQYLGMPSEEISVEPTLSDTMPAQPGDRYLLCSDGLTDMVEDASIEKALSQAANAQDAAVRLVQSALKNGGKDNVTVLCVFVRKGGVLAGHSPLKKAMLFGGLALGLTGLAFLAELVYRLI